MFGEQRTRTMLGPADPARIATAAPPRLSARDLIAHAEATVESHPEATAGRWADGTASPVAARGPARPARWILLVGAVVVAAGAVAVIQPFTGPTGDGTRDGDPVGVTMGPVLVPIAYQFDTGAGPAGAKLRALAGRIVDAPYEKHTGQYTYHHTRSWGQPKLTSADGRYHIGFSEETKKWEATEVTGQQVTTQLEREFPDQASRDYWSRNLKAPAPGTTSNTTLPPTEFTALPSDRARLTKLLRVQLGAGAVRKEVATVYGRYAVPRQTRAEILRVLADVPGFVWRGKVTDRAGRSGVAITFDDREHDQQSLLIFNPETGELLANELLVGTPIQISAYSLILGTDRTDQLG